MIFTSVTIKCVISLLFVTMFTTGCVNMIAFHPSRGGGIPPGVQYQSVQDVELTTRENVRLHAYFVPNPNSDRAVLFLHGNAGNATDRLDDALKLSEIGLNVLLLDYRGYGKSAGRPSEAGVYEDGRTALRYLYDELKFKPNRTIILGRSLGSAVAIDLATQNECGGVVLVTPLSSGNDAAKAMGLGWIAWLFGKPFNSIEKISKLKCPALFIHGTHDEIIPIAHGRKLYEACPTMKRFVEVPGAGHNDLTYMSGEAYWQWIQDFCEQSFGGQSSDNKHTPLGE